MMLPNNLLVILNIQWLITWGMVMISLSMLKLKLSTEKYSLPQQGVSKFTWPEQMIKQVF